MKTFIVDSFTNRPFAGNPAGVCFVESALADDTMLKVAQELGLSETAFVAPLVGRDAFAIRFFSPKMEIPLCGHATLASAKVVFEKYRVDTANFINPQNLDLRTTRVDGGVQMVFPVYDTSPAQVPPALLRALGLADVQNVAYNAETKIMLLEIDDAHALAELQPDFLALIRSTDAINGVLVTASTGDDGYDFHSRYFWPWSGTNEDPVTGGTHTFLAKYWAERLGKLELRSFQSSKRGGFMQVVLDGEELLITGDAVIVFEGELLT